MWLSRAGICLAGTFALAACSGADAVPGFSRETAPDGRTIVSYTSGLAVPEDTLLALFEIGRYRDDSSQIFEDLRDLDIAPDGRLYALDAGAKEIRVFNARGALDTIISRAGDGPGEISSANGIRFGPDGTLWLNDHGKRALLALDAEGRERVRLTSIVPGFGYRWAVVIDTAGVMWEPWSRMLTGPDPDMTANGIAEGTSLRMFKNFDPATDARNSVELDQTAFRSWRATYRGGQMVTGLPFTPRPFLTIDRHRRVWAATGESYTLMRMDLTADTTMELRVTETGPAVTPTDITEWEKDFQEMSERAPTLVGDLRAFMPTHKSPIAQVFTDDQDRLWIGRTVPSGEPSRWDIFTADGDLLAVLRAPTVVVGFLSPVVVGDRIYMVAEGDAGERYIVAAALPEWK